VRTFFASAPVRPIVLKANVFGDSIFFQFQPQVTPQHAHQASIS